MRTALRPVTPLALLSGLALATSGCIVVVKPAPESTRHALSAPVEASAALAADAALEGERSPAERVIELARRDNRVQEHLRHLSLTVGPRLTGSHGLLEAEQWCRDQLAAWGLDARLERWGEFAVGFDRGHASGALLAPRRIEFVFTTPAWTPGTEGPARGPALPWPADEAALEALRPALQGAWIVRPAGERPQREWSEAVEQALVEGGAVGQISASRSEELVHTGGNPRIEWDTRPKLCSVVLRGDQHAELVELLAGEAQVELEFDIDNRFFPGPVPLHNVVADLVGSERPDEYVIVCGHLDSWDGAQGTVDNGTGVATTLEAARLLAESGLRPRRTIRFILWSGEEQGLLGSRAYVEQNPEILPRVSAVLNHDGGTNYLSGLAATPEMMPALREACAALFELEAGMPFELREVEALSGGGGSDHASFVRAGVPGFFWMQSGRSDYNRHHHTQYDTFEAAIPAYQRHSAVVAAVTAVGLADQDEPLDRTFMEPIEPRRLGVRLDGATVARVMEEGKAAEAGWQDGDVIVAVDGQELGDDRRALMRQVQEGGPRFVFTLRRGEETIESVLDWSDDPAELERVRRAQARAKARGR